MQLNLNFSHLAGLFSNFQVKKKIKSKLSGLSSILFPFLLHAILSSTITFYKVPHVLMQQSTFAT